MALPIVTGMGEARNAILIRSAQAILAIGGEYGTLSEIAFALKFSRPVVGVQTWQAVSHDSAALPIQRVDGAKAAVQAVLSLIEPGV